MTRRAKLSKGLLGALRWQSGPRPIAPGTRGATDLSTRPGELELDQATELAELDQLARDHANRPTRWEP